MGGFPDKHMLIFYPRLRREKQKLNSAEPLTMSATHTFIILLKLHNSLVRKRILAERSSHHRFYSLGHCSSER